MSDEQIDPIEAAYRRGHAEGLAIGRLSGDVLVAEMRQRYEATPLGFVPKAQVIELRDQLRTAEAERDEARTKYQQLAEASWPKHKPDVSHGRLVHHANDNHWTAEYHRDCRPNRREAEAAMADAKAVNDSNADLIREKRELESALHDARAQVEQRFRATSEYVDNGYRKCRLCCGWSHLADPFTHDKACLLAETPEVKRR